MVNRIGGADIRARSSRRQLPITGSAHKAAVVGDPPVAAVLASLDMTQGRGAAMLDRRHDFELMKAQERRGWVEPDLRAERDRQLAGLIPRRPIGV